MKRWQRSSPRSLAIKQRPEVIIPGGRNLDVSVTGTTDVVRYSIGISDSLSTLQEETTNQSDLVTHMRAFEWFAWGMANFAAQCLAILVLLALCIPGANSAFLLSSTKRTDMCHVRFGSKAD